MTRLLATALGAALIAAGLAGLKDEAFGAATAAKAPVFKNLWAAQQTDLMQQWLDRKQAGGLKLPPKPAGSGNYIYIPGSAAKAAQQ
jgi:hypothetical protein